MVVMDAARPASKFGCVLGYPGPLPCRGCPPSCPEHPEAARPVSEQAARQRAAELQERLGIHVSAASDNGWKGAYAIVDFDGLDALVARVADLEAEVKKAWNFEHKMMERATDAEEKLDAAEAQVAALTQTVEQREIGYRDQLARAEAAEAALANTRQALADVERDIDAAWTKALDDADAYDDDGAHVGLARHARAKAEGLAHAHSIVTIARRALAAAGDNTTEPSAEEILLNLRARAAKRGDNTTEDGAT